MNQVEKRFIDEIDTLLSKAATFNERYNKEVHRIDEQLYEDLLFFATRARFVWENLQKNEFVGLADSFQRTHARLSKSTFHEFSDELIDMTTHLRITKKEIEDGLFFSVSELAKAEVFSDFLESGKHFLNEGYKDAAAIIIGGVLEDKLKTMCMKSGIAHETADGRHLTIEPLNVNLRKADVYNELMKKQITAWSDLRNNAAHARYNEYTAKQVENMYDFVVDFCISY